MQGVLPQLGRSICDCQEYCSDDIYIILSASSFRPFKGKSTGNFCILSQSDSDPHRQE